MAEDDETKTELMNRFFDSQSNLNGSSSNNESRSVTPNPTPTPISSVDESLKELMAELPIISKSEVLAAIEEEDEDIEGLIPVKKPEVEVTDDLVDKLQNVPTENFNGNYDHSGDFRHWHEVVTKESKDGELLFVLPYSLID